MIFLYKIIYTLFRNTRGGVLGSKIRVLCLRKMKCHCAKSSYIGPNVTIISPENLTIGDNTSIHENCYIDASGTVQIGENVSIAHGVSIVSFNHTYKNTFTPIKNQPLEYNPIVIEDNVWIGCKSTLLAGTKINNRTIVAANALCNKCYDGDIIIAGVPAKPIKSI